MVDWSVSMLSQRQPMVATGEPKSIHTGSFVLLGDTVRCLLLSEPGHTVTLCRPVPQSHHSNVLATRVGFSIATEDANKRAHITMVQQYLVISSTTVAGRGCSCSQLISPKPVLTGSVGSAHTRDTFV